MGGQPVELFADVGLGREQQGFLREAVFAEPGAGRDEVGDLLLEPRQQRRRGCVRDGPRRDRAGGRSRSPDY